MDQQKPYSLLLPFATAPFYYLFNTFLIYSYDVFNDDPL